MQLAYYKAPYGNFGDDLNPWLWPQLFPQAFDDDQTTLFIGIGTILGKSIAASATRRIVFGSGVRRPSTAPKLDPSWDVRFVRGPISAVALGLDQSAVISDGAICLGLLPWPAVQRKHKVGFIPHYHLITDYPAISTLHPNIRVIDPRDSVDEVIAAIRSCETLVTESLHGAILADLFRVPWARVSLYSWQTESPDVSSLKWLDWGLSLGVDSFPAESLRVPYHRHRFSRFRRMLYATSRISNLIETLYQSGRFQLSEKSMLQRRLDQASDVVNAFRRDYTARQDKGYGER
jgi:succinoglycan biosynthesis protein ExoV